MTAPARTNIEHPVYTPREMARQQLAVLSAVDPRKSRGAYFTPPALATFLTRWAIAGNGSARILDPSCGEGVFLLAAGRELQALGVGSDKLGGHVTGVDIHSESLGAVSAQLEQDALDATLLQSDFLEVTPPTQLFATHAPFDAVVGNPPYIRYQSQTEQGRKLAAEVALRQGVRLSGLSSTWASILVHAAAFLAPEGRLAMVLPAELLSVHYAEPIRRWLKSRFAAVRLILFETLQFDGAQENVVLLLANGSGGCDSFSLYQVHDADDLLSKSPFNEFSYVPNAVGKWSDVVLSSAQRRIFRRVIGEHFVGLEHYGAPELGAVTGANWFFALSEPTRLKYELEPDELVRICPPGTRHLRGLSFTGADWRTLRDAGDSVWMLQPKEDKVSRGLSKYLRVGRDKDVPSAYKCTIREPWWRPPVVPAPDLFFTYMSHRYPRLIENKAGVTFLNSMHGLRLSREARHLRSALPLLALNSVTMLGAELFGRSYGGGILKMEPREAAVLPIPKPAVLDRVWEVLKPEASSLDRQLRNGLWSVVVAHVDQLLLRDALGLSEADAAEIRSAATLLRSRRVMRQAAATDA